MKNIYIFFENLKFNNGAIWVENEKVKLSIPLDFQNQELDNFIIDNKNYIVSILRENYIFSEMKFQNTLIFKDKTLKDYPLSYAQNRLWFVEQYEGGTNAYHIPSLFEVSIDTDLEGVKYGLQQIVSRHEVLRSTLSQDANNEGIQNVCDLPLSIEEISLGINSDHEQEIKKDINRPFDLSSEYPIRVKLYKVSSLDKTFLLINLHHIAGDGWSMEIFHRELLSYYEAYLRKDTGFSLPALEIQYKDYAVWQREYLTDSVLEVQLSYWKDKLSGYQTLNFPTDYTRPSRVDYCGGSEMFILSKDLSDKLRFLSKSRGVTMNSVLLSSVNILLGKYTGQEDIVIGSVTANRHHRQTEDLIGFFVNTQVNRTQLSDTQSFESLIDLVHKDQIAAQLHQDLPFENLIEELGVVRDSSRHAIFQVKFGVQNFGGDIDSSESSNDFLKPYDLSDSYEVEKFDLSILMDDSGEEIIGQISYATSLFKADTIIRLIDHYIHLLTGLTTIPNEPYSGISLLHSSEYDQVIHDWNATDVEYPKDKTLIELFEEQVSKTPNNIALVYEGEELTYEDLNAKSNQLARHLRREYAQRTGASLSPDTLIALCLDRSLEMIVGILGVLKAGGAYVPMDPGYPQERIDYILEDTKAVMVLSQCDLFKGKDTTLPEDRVVYIDLSASLYKEEDVSGLPSYSGPSDLAYVIYTSGTTGKPKGVMIENHNLTDYIYSIKKATNIEECKSFGLFSTIAGDLGYTVIYPCLLLGGTLYLLTEENILDPKKISQLNLDCIKIVPSYWVTLQKSHKIYTPTKCLIFGGDRLTRDIIREINPINERLEIYNHYGPTETTIGKIIKKVNVKEDFINIPIGKAFCNSSIYILNNSNALLPKGIAGEICISGDGLARGYLNRPELTQEKFIPHPFIKGQRLYKTGDLGRWLSDGNLEYIGRNDDQVKIRGYRIELGEIEHALTSVEGVSQSCVLAKERETESGTSKYLVGYYVLEGIDSGISEDFILDKLSSVLPDYMVPSSLVKLESFPLTINGKLDKKAFPDADFSSSDDLYVAPKTETEIALCGIWEEVLGLDRVGVTDDFFRIGGDSILSIKVSYRMSEFLDKDIKVADIFKYKTISELLIQNIENTQAVIPRVEANSSILSFSQERLWFVEQYEGGTNAYHIPSLFEVSIDTDLEGVKYGLQQIVSRHEVLRSTLSQDANNEGIQNVCDLPLSIEEISLGINSDHEQEIKKDINRPFDLSSEYPIRVKLYKVSSLDKTFLLINLHHIAGDGWSMEIFHRELLSYYEAYLRKDTGFSLPALEIQYKDYAVWQREYLTDSVLEVQLSYWKDKLSGYQILNFPTDYTRPSRVDYCGGSEMFILSKDLSDKLRFLSKSRGVTMNSVLLSSVNILLGKYTGQEDIVIGSVTANRHHRQTEDLIGFFVNTQVNRTQLSDTQSFESLIDLVHKDQIAAQLHQDLPFENLIEELGVVRDSSRHAIFQVMFGVQSFGGDIDSSESSNDFLNPYDLSDSYEVEKFDLSIFIDDSGEEIIGQISYATSLFKADTIIRLIDHYIHLLTGLTTIPNEPYSGISLLHSSEYDQVIHDWNATDVEYPKDKTLIELFEEQVSKAPNNIALVYEGEELTYEDLNAKSNQLARHLRREYAQRTGASLSPDTLIALCLDRSLEMIVGILGVLKAGGAYVPMDPGYPQERIDYILEDTKAVMVLSQCDLFKGKDTTLPEDRVVYIDLSASLYKEEDVSGLPSYSGPSDLAYVIYTSGTTGKPKGVMIEQDSIINYVNNVREVFLGDIINIDFSTNLSFDLTITTTICSLLLSKKIFIYSGELSDTDKYIEHLIINKIDFIKSTPSTLASLPLGNFFNYKIKQAFIGGEKLKDFQVTHISSYIENIIDEYGPTEVTVGTSYISKNVISTKGIGKPYFNYKTYVVDKNMVPVPVGVIGELYIGGAGVSRGYLNNEKLTSERFITNPFASESDKNKGYTRLYKTGDLVRWLPDGNLEYIGRNDDQVKIRGYRIELGEIEHALTNIEGVSQSCVLAKERETESGTSKYLVGYYVLEGIDSGISEEFILNKLSSVLPDYMVPSSLVKLEIFPLTINGKLDKKAFPDADFSSSDDLYVAPETDTEKALCGIWEEVLGLERVGVSDDFFRIGGDSILSIQVSSGIRQLGFSCNVRDIFESKTISKLALVIENKNTEVSIEGEQGILEGGFDLLPIQQWFLERVNANKLASPNHWNQSFLVRVPELDSTKLVSIVESLVSHHDMLRVGYDVEGNLFELKQRYQSNISIPEIKTLDVGLHNEEEVQSELTKWQSDFTLESGPLFQVGYLYGYEDGSARIYFALHHMLVDGVSWRILAADLKTLYLGESLPLKGSSYRQWVSSVKDYVKDSSEEALYWESQFKGIPDYNLAISESSDDVSYFELDESTTSILLQDVSTAYHTEINDLLLTALGYSLKDINGFDVQGITLEGHGREAIDATIDHSTTLGWFTSMFPVKLELKDSLRGSIQSIKDSLHSIPNKGIGFGSYAVSEGSSYTFNDLVPISFNYLGQFEVGDVERDWQVITSEGSGIYVNPLNMDHNIININGAVQKGKLGFSISSKLGATATKNLSTSFKKHLTAIIAHCQESLESSGSLYTSSDFSSVTLSQPLLDQLQVKARKAQNSISHIYPATSLQQGFIYHAISQPDDDAYRVQLLLDYHDYLDVDKYLQAWEYCISEYPILRTGFNWEEELVQVVYDQGILAYELHDISDLATQEVRDERIKSIQLLDRERGFDLTNPGLFRLHIIKQSATSYTILKTEHHSISDGWSGPILLGKVQEYYQGLVLGKEIVIKEDTAYLKTQEYMYSHKSVVSDYWDGILSDVEGFNDINSLLSSPIDFGNYKTVGEPSFNELEIKGTVYKELKSFSQREGITINVIVQFIWHKLLQVYSSSNQSIVGTTVSGRDLPIEGIEESVGLFINTLPLIINWDNDNSILAQLHDIQKQITGLNTHSFANLSKLQKGEGRLFHSLSLFQNLPSPKGFSSEVSKLSKRDSIEKVDYPLGIKAYKYSDALVIELQYDGCYLTADKANSHLARLEESLHDIVKAPNQLHSEISLLSSSEYDQVIHDWNATDVEYPNDKTLIELFEGQVSDTPGNIALVYEGKELSYEDLNRRSNQLARDLRREYEQRTGGSLTPDTLIALCLDRSLEMIIGILGVLKAGGAYVPMDPGYPQERIDYILGDTNAVMVLSQRDLFEGKENKLPADRVVYIDLTESLYQEEEGSSLPIYSGPSDLAYVIYTSGTTGKPKGVMVEHSSVVNLVFTQKSKLKVSSNSNVLQFASYVFDGSIPGIFVTLLFGAKLSIISEKIKENANLLSNYIEEYEINIATIPPALLSMMEYKELPNLHTLKVAGESCPLKIMNQWSKDRRLLNGYGPTEVTVGATMNIYIKGDLNTNIGKPFDNTKLYVLDVAGQPVPVGVIGELYIGGAGLSRGYLNNEELTLERFIANPFSSESDKERGYTRLYKTGDLVRWLANGNLEYIGRNDDQVKIRGYRIELGEIEKTLLQHNAVSQSCVLVKNSLSSQSKKIIGYYIDKELKEPQDISWWPSIAEYCDHVYDDLLYSLMTSHENRNNSYRMAIRNNVNDKVVVDIGTGPDAILARICLDEGAKKVYAIEYSKETYIKAKKTIIKYNLEDKIHLIHGDSLKVSLPEQADVCVSALVGAIGGAEGVAVLLNDARLRHVKPNGKFIPESSITKMALIELPESLITTPLLSDRPYEYTERIFSGIGHEFDLRLCLKGVGYNNLISSIDVFEDLDWKKPELIPLNNTHEINIDITKTSVCYGCLVWLDLSLEKGYNVDILDDQYSWIPVFLPIFPEGISLEKGNKIKGTIERRLCSNNFNFDYIIKGEVSTSTSINTFYYNSKHLSQDYGSNSFYKKFFNVYKNYDSYSISRLEKYLANQLPDYMIPSSFVKLESFPLTINGKLDKKALPEADFSSSDDLYVAPETDTEKALCVIWEEVLGLDRVGVTDDFFRIGGDSILSIKVSYRMGEFLDKDIKVVDIFKYKTISELLVQNIDNTHIVIPKVASNSSILSFSQERLWFVEQYEGGTNAYHMPSVFEVGFDTDVEGIKYALQQIVNRHEVLRSTLSQDVNNEGIQTVCDLPLSIEEVILGLEFDYEQEIKQDINRPFDLSSEYPIRVKLYEVASLGKTFLLINLHHIAGDGWSMDIFYRELLEYYEAYLRKDIDFRLPALEIQYKDYAIWQREYLTDSVLEGQLSYWKDKLLGYQTLNFPTDYVRPSTIDYKGASERFSLTKNLSDKLRYLSKSLGVTMNSVLLSSVNILLSKYTGQDDIVIGGVTANRHYRQTEDLIGFFINTQVNRTLLNNSQSFEDLIDFVHKDQVAAQLHQDLPFENLIEELGVVRDSSRHAIFQVMFGVQNFGGDVDNSGSSQGFLEAYDLSGSYEVAKFDLSILIDDNGEELIGKISYATSLFKSGTIVRFIEHYIHLLTELTSTPDRPYSEISLLSSSDYDEIVHNWNATDTEYPNDKTLIELFELQVSDTPDNIALVYEGEELSYSDLNRRSNQLARHLRKEYEQRTGASLAPDTLIALCLDRSLEMIVGILGVLKAGGAYVPIDPSYPQERIDYILADTNSVLVLSQRDLFEGKENKLPEDRVVYIDLSSSFYKEEEEESSLPSYSGATDLAYVIYTSGTTGKPKGVMVEHNGATNYINSQYDFLKKPNKKRFYLLHSYAFDTSISCIFGALCFSNTLVITNDSNRLSSKAYKDYNIHIAYIPPALLASMENKEVSSLETIIVSGELADTKILNLSSEVNLINEYGPTEAVVGTSYYELNKNSKINTIGQLVNNKKAYILDTNIVPVPVGVIGELYIGGAGLSRGYLNNDLLTSERFIANPFAGESDKKKGYTRLYKTGDLVRWLPEGNLEYIGRNDDQVKIRGHRIELGEIEHSLTNIDGVSQSCVLAKERVTDSGMAKYLVGYYVLEGGGAGISEDFILGKLSNVLPDYMVPSNLVKLDDFPLTINGKLDKKALPDTAFSSSDALYVAPETETEKALCVIWEEVLGLDRVGVTDDFFRIGGDSILSIKISYRMSEFLDKDIKVADVFRLKSIKNILKIQYEKLALIEEYNFKYNFKLEDMIFVHPAGAGTEVYQNLSELFVSEYNCIGINNYNLHSIEKIDSLNELAKYYLSEYEQKYKLKETINLFGWSLGGQIALEMAVLLENRGYKKINVILLDTIIVDDYLRMISENKNNKNVKKRVKDSLINEEFENDYIEKVIANLDIERKMSKEMISSRLKFSKVMLFKAVLMDDKNITLNSRQTHEYITTLKKNNVDTIVDDVEVINLDCHHGNIIIEYGEDIYNYILSGIEKDK